MALKDITLDDVYAELERRHSLKESTDGLSAIVIENTFYVRYAETDAMGIVHHASYIVYFEEGRSNYARQRGSDYASFERSGRYLTVAEVNARYIKPAVYGQLITVRCWIEEMKSRALTFAYEIVDAANPRPAGDRQNAPHLHHPRWARHHHPRRVAALGCRNRPR